MKKENMIKKLHNKYKNMKTIHRVGLFFYITFLIILIVVLLLSIKYQLYASSPYVKKYPKVLLEDINLNNYEKDSNGYLLFSKNNKKIIYNEELKSIKLISDNANYPLIPFNEYKKIKGYSDSKAINLYKYPTEDEKNIFSGIKVNLTYSTSPNEIREVYYNQMEIASIKKIKDKKGIVITYHIKNDPYDESLFPRALTQKQLIKVLTKIKNNKMLTDTLKLSYVRKTDNKYSKLLYELNIPAQNHDFHKENIRKIWYEVYDLNKNEDLLRKLNNNFRINKYSFKIPVAYYFNDNKFMQTIITDMIESKSSIVSGGYWTILSISLSPNFLATKKENFKEVIVPDGQGAIIRDPNGIWNGSVYNNDYYIKEHNYKRGSPNIKIPFMGIIKTNDSKTEYESSYFFIESGMHYAFLNLSPTADFVRFYPTFSLRMQGMTDFIGDQKVAAISPEYRDVRFTVSYNFLESKNKITYFDIINDFKDKYINKEKKEFSPEVGLEFLGSIIKPEHILGIPYEKQIPLTRYIDAKKIKKDLNIPNTSFYNNWQKGANYFQIPSYKLSSFNELGFNKDLKDLENDNTYLIQSFVKTYKNNKGNFKNKSHGMQTLSGNIRKNYEYDKISNTYAKDSIYRYYLLSPKYLEDVARRYKNTEYQNLAISDITNIPIIDYSSKDYTPNDLALKKKNALKTLKKEKLALNDPYYYLLGDNDVIYDIEIKTSDVVDIYSPIPLYSLILGDYHKMFMPSVNIKTGTKKEYYPLYSLISGVNIKYTISNSNTEITKDTYYFNEYYSCMYCDYKDEIKDNYKMIKSFYENYGSKIISHDVLEYNVFLVSFSNGSKITKIIFNLNGSIYNDVNSFSYKVIGG